VRRITSRTLSFTSSGFAAAEQGAQAFDHVARAAVFANNVGYHRPQLVEVRVIRFEQEFRRLGVAENDAERLVQLVRERAGQHAERGNPGKMGQAPGGIFRVPPIGDINADANQFADLAEIVPQIAPASVEPAILAVRTKQLKFDLERLRTSASAINCHSHSLSVVRTHALEKGLAG
jgi:hypothetical protein